MDIFYFVKVFADWVTFGILNIAPDSAMAYAVNFFIYDTIKILILLFVVMFCVSVFRTFITPEKTRRVLSHQNEYVGNVLASFLGIITPFCSCSAISLFMGFVEAGVPLGVTFSFLVAAPMINEVAVVLLWGVFGFKVMAIYIASGITIAVISGIIIGKMKVENLIEQSVFCSDNSSNGNANLKIRWKTRFKYAKNYTLGIISKIWIYIVFGIGVGALIHGYVPADFLAAYAGSDKWYGVLVATLIGIPLYSNAAGIIPLVGVLMEKGVAMGTVLAFMMSVTALSLPEFMILRKIMKIKLLAIFAGIVATGIIITGYLFNFLL